MNKRFYKVSILAASIAFALFCTNTYAVSVQLPPANIFRILNHSTLFGGCLALLDVNPKDHNASCGPSWVSFDCLGVTRGSDLASLGKAMEEKAIIAMLTDRKIELHVNTDLMVNGYCVVERLDLY